MGERSSQGPVLAVLWRATSNVPICIVRRSRSRGKVVGRLEAEDGCWNESVLDVRSCAVEVGMAKGRLGHGDL